MGYIMILLSVYRLLSTELNFNPKVEIHVQIWYNSRKQASAFIFIQGIISISYKRISLELTKRSHREGRYFSYARINISGDKDVEK